MNCQSCNTEIDYRFLTSCAGCGCAVHQASLTETWIPPEFPPVQPVDVRLGWRKALVNVFYVLLSSVVGMISGAVTIYFGAAFVFLALLRDDNLDPSTACARGTAIGVLSVLSGGFLGTMCGSAFAVKRPLCKP